MTYNDLQKSTYTVIPVIIPVILSGMGLIN
jgi:hypothetical protein